MSMGKQIYYHNIRENIKHMHPRLKELAIQAGATPDNGTIITSSMDESKFAELIIRECVLISRTSTDGFSAGKRMEEHFGVES